jgi:hypothetical protein
MSTSLYDTTIGQQVEFNRVLSSGGMSREMIEGLIMRPGLSSIWVEQLRELFGRQYRDGATFPLTIDYTKSLAELVAAGGYDYANPNITEENFPVGSGEAEVASVLVHLDRLATSEEVLDELERKGIRAATMVELLAFGAKHPDKQRQFPIIALGSVRTDPNGDRRVGYLWERPGSRSLDLLWFVSRWSVRFRFLAVRK